MPFGCLPIRQAEIDACEAWHEAAGLQCLSAVCLSGRRRQRLRPAKFVHVVSNAFRLCAYPAENVAFDMFDFIFSSLQCLSAVCLSGRNWSMFSGTDAELAVSNAFRLSAYPAAGIENLW